VYIVRHRVARQVKREVELLSRRESVNALKR
jgi:hypothetical protein